MMYSKTLRAISLATIATVAAISANATLVGSSINGQMLIGGSGQNYFDPAIGFVPNGPLNKTSGTTVTVGSGVEFGYLDGSNGEAFDFSANGFSYTNSHTGSSSLPITFIFSDSAFLGLSLSELTDNFPGGVTASLAGNTLTVQLAQYTATTATFTATYALAATNQVPEPGSLALLGLGLAGLAAIRKRKQA